jgi:hypothetical protein
MRSIDGSFCHGAELRLTQSSLPATVPIVCLAVGELYGMAELYVSRLYEMLGRHCARPFVLYCYTDRRRNLPAAIEQRDCAGWTELERPGMRATTRKLGLFNPRYVEFESFFYLDLSLIVRRPLDEMLTQAFAMTEALVIVKHWSNDGYNSSVMRIRRGPLTRIYDAFVAGEQYAQDVPGDQDFVRGVVLRHGLLSQVGHFAAHQIVSFKKTVQAGRRDAALARQRILDATIVKFHGSPKMHEAFALRYHLHLRFEELLHGNLRPVLPMRALQCEWQGLGTST